MAERSTPSDAADRGVRRRTVLAGAAWSVPVLAVATAAPAGAASDPCANYVVIQEPVKDSGAWQYVDTFVVMHNGVPIDLTNVVVTVAFDPEPPYLGATSNHNCTVVLEGRARAIFTGTGGTSMSSTLQLGSGNDGPSSVSGIISVEVPGCPGPVDSRPFTIPVVKDPPPAP